MKKFIMAMVVAALIGPAATAQVRVKGYTKKDGTYVAPHYRSSPNGTTRDNYSTRGNTNPYTGEYGTRDADTQRSAGYGTSNYGKPAEKASCTFYCPD